jgi:hypothetical protein
MNAFSKNITPTSGIDNPFEKRPNNLFDDAFVKNYKDMQMAKNNENMNIINSIFGNPGAQPSSFGGIN